MSFPLRAARSSVALYLALVSTLFSEGCSPPASDGTQSGGSGPTPTGGATSGGVGGPTTGGLSGGGGAIGQGGAGGLGTSGGTGGLGTSGGSGGSVNMPVDNCDALPVGAVTFSVASGTFEGSLSVELRTSQAGAEIRYTTNHTAPNATSMLYTGPIALSATTELIAQAFVQGASVGQPQTAVYVARSFDAMHDLPVIVLDSYGTPVPGQASGTGGRGGTGGKATDEYIHAAMLSFEPSAGATSLAANPKVASAAGFHIRGQSSSNYAKKPYRLELHQVDGTDRNCPMLSMPSDSDWVLHSPFPDKALIRNAFVYSLGPEMGLPAPRGKFAEVYVNSAARPIQASDYVGVYLLVETIKNQRDRLNLQQLDTTDTALPAIAGGYIFKFEWQVMDIEQRLACPSGQQNCWNFLEVTDPKPWNTQQQDYLTMYLQSFVNALHSATPSDPTSGYPSLLDTASFVNQVIMHELTRNLDAYTRSQYLHKDRTGKIKAGPLWDYDLIAGVGSAQSYANLSLSGWQYESVNSRFATTADWFPKLIADPAFKAALVARWKELRQGVLSDAQVTARIAMLTAGLANGAQRNFTKWNNLTTQRIGFFDTPTANTWEGQVTAMREWLLGRMAWLDTSWQ